MIDLSSVDRQALEDFGLSVEVTIPDQAPKVVQMLFDDSDVSTGLGGLNGVAAQQTFWCLSEADSGIDIGTVISFAGMTFTVFDPVIRRYDQLTEIRVR